MVLDQVLTATQLKTFRQQYEKLSFGDGRATAGERAAQVKRNLQLANDTAEHAALSEIIHQALASSATFMSAVLPRQISPPLFNRYLAGMAFGQHVDNAIRIDGEAPLRADVSVTMMLSDPEDYQGGDLVIEDTYGERRIRLQAGSMVIYPSSSLHRVEPITKGNRDVVVLWAQSMVRDVSQRALLFKLDQSIQNIRRQTPNSSEIDSLLAIYNNLLRMWTEL
ncbi:MAG: Fe2+-dependent dioxygenase [Methylotenera sp.]